MTRDTGPQGRLISKANFAWVMHLADSSVAVRYHGWVDQQAANFMVVRSVAIRLDKKALDEAGIDMPEPTFNLRLQRVSGADAGQAAERAAESGGEEMSVQPDRDLEEQVREYLDRPGGENLLSRDGTPRE